MSVAFIKIEISGSSKSVNYKGHATRLQSIRRAHAMCDGSQ